MSGAVTVAAPGHAITASNLATAIVDTLTLPFNARYWGFWLVNLGVAVPLTLAVLLLAIGRLFRDQSIGRAAGRVLGIVPPAAVRFLLACIPVFVLCNVAVLQSWDWDNTKLLVYWYLGVALVVGAITVHLWAGVWRRILAVLLAGSVLATGSLALLRLLPYTPAPASVTGPYVVASAADLRMASVLEAQTAPGAVFLISANTDDFFDPVPLLTGRPVVLDYYPWLWSYGLDYGQRLSDVETAMAGCGSTPLMQCPPILDVLRRYHVSYVEVNQSFPAAGVAWWAAQQLPVTASAPGTTVYDVRTTQ
jgi:hypothetical protein